MDWREATRGGGFWQYDGTRDAGESMPPHLPDHWYKKDVQLRIAGHGGSFAVAQELFSSHDVDVGSRHLLRSLADVEVPVTGTALDFGCGYGVLGIAWGMWQPAWTIHLVDRDSLAVEFSTANADRHGMAERMIARAGLDASGEPPTGWDMVLWNVPGKAGPTVLRALLKDVIDRISDSGLVALVIVNPLAELFDDEFASMSQIVLERRDVHAEHTVMHIRRTEGRTRHHGTTAFTAGAFDRSRRSFAWNETGWSMVPVVGLHEYDSLSFATQLAIEHLMELAAGAQSVLFVRPGQGHMPCALAQEHQPAHVILFDRDLLALEASRRALLGAGMSVSRIECVNRPDINRLEVGINVVVMMLEEGLRLPVLDARLHDLARMTGLESLVIAGSSAMVSRCTARARKLTGWRASAAVKRSGAATMHLRVRPGVNR